MKKIEIDFYLKNSSLKLNRSLNIISGLWPFQSKLEKYTLNFFYLTLLSVSLLPEVSVTIRSGTFSLTFQ